MEIGQIAGRYTCRATGMKGSFLRLRILEHGMSCIPAPSLAAFEDQAGKPLPGGTQAGALLQPFFPLLPHLPHFPPLSCAELLVFLLKIYKLPGRLDWQLGARCHVAAPLKEGGRGGGGEGPGIILLAWLSTPAWELVPWQAEVVSKTG